MPQLKRPQAVLFDLYNTLIDIRTEEDDALVWARLARYLVYYGLVADPQCLHAAFRLRVSAMQHERGGSYPEIDMVAIFERLLAEKLGYSNSAALALPVTLLFRTLSMRRLALFPDVLPALGALAGLVKLGLVSDAQRVWLEPEMAQLGLRGFFKELVLSSDYGFRKPDPRLFHVALAKLKVTADQAVYVGDNAFRDICGAQTAGIKGILVTRHVPFDEPCACRPDLTIGALDELVAWVSGSRATQL